MRSARRWSWWVMPSVASITQQGHVGAVEGLQGPHHRVVLGALVGAGLAPHPGGVDEADRAVGRLDHGVDGVAGGAGQVVDDRALLADQPVEQRRLAHVGPARPWPPRRPGRLASPDRWPLVRASVRSPSSAPRSRRRWREHGRPPRRGGHRCPARAGRSPARVAQPERHELPGVRPRGWCRRPCWRPAAPAARRGAGARPPAASSSVTPTAVSTTSSTTSASRMARSLCAADLGVEVVAARPASPRCRPPRTGGPFHSASSSLRSRVTPGLLLDDGLAAADDPVHERRLAHVGAAHDGDHGQARGGDELGQVSLVRRPRAPSCRAGRRPGRARHAARPRRWGRPRPAGAGRRASVPSRKRPSDRQTSGSR